MSLLRATGQGMMSRMGWWGVVSWRGVGWRFAGRFGGRGGGGAPSGEQKGELAVREKICVVRSRRVAMEMKPRWAFSSWSVREGGMREWVAW